jgi:hypothetical protein
MNIFEIIKRKMEYDLFPVLNEKANKNGKKILSMIDEIPVRKRECLCINCQNFAIASHLFSKKSVLDHLSSAGDDVVILKRDYEYNIQKYKTKIISKKRERFLWFLSRSRSNYFFNSG